MSTEIFSTLPTALTANPLATAAGALPGHVPAGQDPQGFLLALLRHLQSAGVELPAAVRTAGAAESPNAERAEDVLATLMRQAQTLSESGIPLPLSSAPASGKEASTDGNLLPSVDARADTAVSAAMDMAQTAEWLAQFMVSQVQPHSESQPVVLERGETAMADEPLAASALPMAFRWTAPPTQSAAASDADVPAVVDVGDRPPGDANSPGLASPVASQPVERPQAGAMTAAIRTLDAPEQAGEPKGDVFSALPLPSAAFALAPRPTPVAASPVQAAGDTGVDWSAAVAALDRPESADRSGLVPSMVEPSPGELPPVLEASQTSAAPVVAADDRSALSSAAGTQFSPAQAVPSAPAQRGVDTPQLLERPLGHPAWPQELSEKVVWIAGQGQQSAELKLNPQHLGPLEVRIHLDQDQASVQFISSHAAVREAVESALPRLREMLSAQQLNLHEVSVAQQGYSEQRDPRSAQYAFGQQSSDSGRSDPGHGGRPGEDTPGYRPEADATAVSRREKGLLSLYA